MQYLLVILVIALCVSYSRTLVHFKKLEKGKNGCKTDKGVELKLGEFVQDPNTCGAIRCEGKDGKALIYYCQSPPQFAFCSEKRYISTALPFPRCCYSCVEAVDCEENKKTYK